ncbi:MAG: flagellar motor protein MotA [Alphaproteobacteria bacterium]|nr:flagellar motor protein MotA [Alphaproteobacteria bacterium]
MPSLTKPQRFLNRMIAFLVAVAIVCALIAPALYSAFLGNPMLNGIIMAAMLVGIGYIFRQVLTLGPDIAWIESFRRNQGAVSSEAVPRLLSPMAKMLGERKGGRVSLSAVSLRTVLDGIATRLDESREISRYFIGLLVFLGLLGTFYGLLETLRSVGGVINGLSIGGGDVGRAFNDLKTGLQSPLSGMGTAFSASLFGLAGSLVLGFLELQAGQAQNRFYNDLEEWLSSYTRLSAAGPLTDSGEGSVPAYIQALLEQTADSLDNLQRIIARGEESRIAANTGLIGLTDRLGMLGDQMKTEQNLLLHLAESQMELKPVLQKLAETGGAQRGTDEVLRGHFRNVETYLARLADELAQGRRETIQEVRSEIRLLARTIAALAEEGER